jgi:hypothetical protein
VNRATDRMVSPWRERLPRFAELLVGFAVRWTAGISGAEITMSFINQAAFNHHRSEQIAISADRRPSKAITDPQGRVQIYIQTGGILNPSGYELHPGAIVFIRAPCRSRNFEGLLEAGFELWRVEPRPELDQAPDHVPIGTVSCVHDHRPTLAMASILAARESRLMMASRLRSLRKRNHHRVAIRPVFGLSRHRATT